LTVHGVPRLNIIAGCICEDVSYNITFKSMNSAMKITVPSVHSIQRGHRKNQKEKQELTIFSNSLLDTDLILLQTGIHTKVSGLMFSGLQN
jgi:hypothetical protein